MHREHRLRSSTDLRRVLASGSRVTVGELVVHHRDRGEPGPVRIGFSADRRLGGAVVRNRSKRLLREALRPLAGRLRDGVDIVVSVKGPIAGMRLDDLAHTLEDAAARAGLFRPTTDIDDEATSP